MREQLSAALQTRALGKQCEVFDTLPSTQTRAAELALQGCAHGTVVYTREQTAGRGRAGRTWLSSAQSLCFSVVLREHIHPAEAFQWSFVAGLALRDVIGGDLKWPNDVLINRRKVAGILCTLELSPSPAVIVGIGLNLGFDPTHIDQSLRAAALSPADHAATLAALLLALERRSDRHPEHTLRDYRAHLALVGESVSVLTQTSKITGTLEGMSDTFELIVQHGGARHFIASADVWPLG